MLRNVFLKTLRDYRGVLIWWSVGLLATVFYLTFFYPSFRDSAAQLTQLMQRMPEVLKAMFGGALDFASPAGFLNTELFSLMLPLILVLFAAGFGSSAIAGEEERGTLDLLLSNPLARWRVVVEKFAAMAACTIALGIMTWLGLAIGTRAVAMEISLGRLAEAVTSATLLGLATGSLSLALGSARGDRGLAVGVTVAVVVASYLVNGLAATVDALKPYRKLSIFYYYIGSNPLFNGLNWWHAAVLVALAVAFLVVAVLTFERRDLAV